jgi:hypothetical protein
MGPEGAHPTHRLQWIHVIDICGGRGETQCKPGEAHPGISATPKIQQLPK